ncbi:MAG: HDOD domain-containing protein [Myxococcales bacterium]|nr:HDOD domain-containing protein [Myxococcales bacterium]
MTRSSNGPLPEHQIIEKIDEIPPLPTSALQLVELIEDPSATPLALARLIEQDVALAARVLHLANSAFYGVAGGVDSLERAVCFLGFTTIQQIALYFHSRQILDEAGARPPAPLWHHAHRVAKASRTLAARLGLPMTGRFFTAGLLHDLGRVALFVLFPEHAGAWRPASRSPLERLVEEHALFGMDHQQAALHLAQRWRYPSPLAQVISGLHASPGTGPTVSPEEDAMRLVVAFSDGCAHATNEQEIPGVAVGPERSWLHGLGLPEDQLDALQDLVQRELSADEQEEGND